MIDLDDLEPEFRKKLVAVIREYLAAGSSLEMLTGTISAQQQAKLWRRSRSDVEIDHAIFELEQEKCVFIAEILKKANAPVGVAVTADLPGFAWQNYGEAVELRKPDDKEALNLLKKLAKKHELTIDNSFGGELLMRKSPFASPTEVYKMREIDKLMQERWGS